jgi:hypothetical protein
VWRWSEERHCSRCVEQFMRLNLLLTPFLQPEKLSLSQCNHWNGKYTLSLSYSHSTRPCKRHSPSSVDRSNLHPINVTNNEKMLALVKTSVGTKFAIRWFKLMGKLALRAVRSVAKSDPGRTTEDIKRCARVEKIPGGESKELCALSSILKSR